MAERPAQPSGPPREGAGARQALETGLAASVSLQRTLRELLTLLGPAAVAPCWARSTYLAEGYPRPPTELSGERLRQLKVYLKRAMKGLTVAGRAQQMLEAFLLRHDLPVDVQPQRRRRAPVVVIDLSENDQPKVIHQRARQQDRGAPPPKTELDASPAAPALPGGPTNQQVSNARDLASQLKGLRFAVERAVPVAEDAIIISESKELEFTNAPVSLLPSTAKFTCPVCLDDEVSVQDAFAIERCGHRVCRPCALRLVDHNIKQLQAQCCPQCQGEPCSRCPITLHKQIKEAQERCEQRQRERVESCAERKPKENRVNVNHVLPNGAEPMAYPVGWGHPADDDWPLEGSDEGEHGRGYVGEEGEQINQPPQGEAPADDTPKVKYCCMSQADMRLLLQPEQLQQQQVQRREAKKQRRQRRAKRKASAAEAEAQAAEDAAASKRQRSSASKKKGLNVTAVPSRFGGRLVPMVTISDSDTEDTPVAKRRKGANRAVAAPAAEAAQAISDGREDLGETSSEDEGWGWSGEGPPPTYEAYLKAEALRAAHGEHLFHLCPKCGEGVVLEEGTTRLQCPSCRADKCVSCGVDWHEGSTCDKYQEWARENAQADEAIKKMTETGEIRTCPQCKTGIQKIDGCHHMTCTRCGCKFCYRCGSVKKGRNLQTHGCDCMNGAAWEHDYRARDNMQPVVHPPAPAGPAARRAHPPDWGMLDFPQRNHVDHMMAHLHALREVQARHQQVMMGMFAGVPDIAGLVPVQVMAPVVAPVAPVAAVPAPAVGAGHGRRRRRH